VIRRSLFTVSMCVACIGFVSWRAIAQEKQSANTMKLAADQKPGSATIADMAWMAGHWVGEGLGGYAEEIWSPPRGGVMMGVFRVYKGDKPFFYEIMILSEHEGSLILKIKHFNPDVTGWEEKDKSVDFPLVTKSEGGMYFNGLTFRPEGADGMTAIVAIHGKDGTVREEAFRYKRKATLKE
jgi:hypothetical protein